MNAKQTNEKQNHNSTHDSISNIDNLISETTASNEKSDSEKYEKMMEVTFKKKRTMHIPEKNRKIAFRKKEDSVIFEGIVRKIYKNQGCTFIELTLDNDDLISLNIDNIFEWRYIKFKCQTCKMEFES